MESTSCELALKPSSYNNNPIIHTIILSSGEQPSSALLHVQSRPGETPTSAHLVSRPGKAPTFRAPQSRPQCTPTSAAGFQEPPNKPAWSRETPYTTRSVFPAVSVSVTSLYPARAGIPLINMRSHPHFPDSGLCGVSPAGTGSQFTLTQNSQLPSF